VFLAHNLITKQLDYCAANVLQAVLLYILDSEGNFDLPSGEVSAGAGRAVVVLSHQATACSLHIAQHKQHACSATMLRCAGP
jgi:hypothetical protein